MSVVGIGVGDITRGAKIVYKAGQAISEGSDGARRHFQQTRAALAQRSRALEDLSASTGIDTDHTVQDAFNISQTEDFNLQIELSRFERALGRGGKKGLSRGVIDKLRFAFNDDKRVREHYERTRPAVDAAMLHVMRHVLERLDTISDDAQRDHSQQSIGYLPLQASFSGLKSPDRASTRPHTVLAQRELEMTRSFSVRKAVADNTFSAKQQSVANTAELFDHTTKLAARLFSNDSAPGAAEAFYPLLAMSLLALYRSPAVRKAAVSQLTEARQDPILALLLGLLLMALTRTMLRVPRLLEGLSDDYIYLQTALGEDIRVPSIYWRSYEIFHGYLGAHFRQKPGSALVARKSYRILLGGMGGVIIDEQRWQTAVSKHLKLSMAMLLDGNILCPRCAGSLEEKGDNNSFCSTCAETYWTTERQSEVLSQYYAIQDTSVGSQGFYRYQTGGPGPSYLDSSTDTIETLYFANILLSRSPSLSDSTDSSSFDQSLDWRLASDEAWLDLLNERDKTSSKPSQGSQPKDFDYAIEFVQRIKASVQRQKTAPPLYDAVTQADASFTETISSRA